MNLEFSYDIYWDTKIVKTVDQISILAEKYFEGKDYGMHIDEIIVHFCCSINRNFKPTKWYNKIKRKELFFTVIIDYDYFMKLNDSERKNTLALYLLKDINILSSIKLEGFVLNELINDFEVFFKNIGWIE